MQNVRNGKLLTKTTAAGSELYRIAATAGYTQIINQKHTLLTNHHRASI